MNAKLKSKNTDQLFIKFYRQTREDLLYKAYFIVMSKKTKSGRSAKVDGQEIKKWMARKDTTGRKETGASTVCHPCNRGAGFPLECDNKPSIQ